MTIPVDTCYDWRLDPITKGTRVLLVGGAAHPMDDVGTVTDVVTEGTGRIVVLFDDGTDDYYLASVAGLGDDRLVCQDLQVIT